jgi:hypothetical protein
MALPSQKRGFSSYEIGFFYYDKQCKENTDKGKAEGHNHSKSGGGQLTRGGDTGAHTVYGRT